VPAHLGSLTARLNPFLNDRSTQVCSHFVRHRAADARFRMRKSEAAIPGTVRIRSRSSDTDDRKGGWPQIQIAAEGRDAVEGAGPRIRHQAVHRLTGEPRHRRARGSVQATWHDTRHAQAAAVPYQPARGADRRLLRSAYQG